MQTLALAGEAATALGLAALVAALAAVRRTFLGESLLTVACRASRVAVA